MKNFDLFFQKLVDIKESWEIFRIFESEREKFAREQEEYDAELEKTQENLRIYRNKIAELKKEVAKLQTQKENHEKSLKLLEEKKTKQRIKNQVKKIEEEKKEIKEKKQEIFPDAMSQVEVFDENGEIKKMRCVRRIYDESLYNKYRIALKEGREFRNKIAELELENSRLKIELRDFCNEIALKERLEG